jgi:hypothetical protein
VYYCGVLLYYILSFIFPSNTTQQYTNQPTHISLCIIEFIGRTMLLRVSAHGAIFRLYNYAFYMDPYIVLIIVSYNNLKNIICFSNFCLITVICTDYIVTC